MTLDGYKDYLGQKGVSSEKMEKALTFMGKFESYLLGVGSDLSAISYDAVQDFAAKMIQEHLNKYENFVFILYFGYYLNHHGMITAAMETIDGGEMFPNLSKQQTTPQPSAKCKSVKQSQHKRPPVNRRQERPSPQAAFRVCGLAKALRCRKI